MNIKSNKEDKKKNNFSYLNLIGQYSNTYIFISTIIVVGLIALFGGGWVAVMVMGLLGIAGQITYIISTDGSRQSNARYYENGNYGLEQFNWFSFIGLPLITLALMYPIGIKPMIYNYENAERIDKVLVMDVNTTLYYNDNNRMFVLFVDGKKQPLIIDKSGSTETYNRLKADYLDNKIKVVKKETKHWSENNSTIAYTLDDYKFD